MRTNVPKLPQEHALKQIIAQNHIEIDRCTYPHATHVPRDTQYTHTRTHADTHTHTHTHTRLRCKRAQHDRTAIRIGKAER